MVKPAGNWVPSISEDRRNYTPQAGFEEKLQAKTDEIKRNPSGLFSSPICQPNFVFGARSRNADLDPEKAAAMSSESKSSGAF